MSTLAEIEAAIELLPAPQFEELARWIEYRRAQSATECEKKTSVTSYFGATRGKHTNGADNVTIDRDLAAEAGRGLV